MVREDVSTFYDELSKNYRKTHANRFVDTIFQCLLYEYLPKRKLRLLDAGGGVGRFSFPLARQCTKIVLIDISKGILNEAQKLANLNHITNIEFYHESVTDMKHQKSDYFDVVLLMNGVLDYCGNHHKALRETYRVLKKGGLVIGTVNNRLIYATTNVLIELNDIEGFLKTFRTGNYRKKFMIHDFTYDELIHNLKRTNFNDIDIFGPTNLARKWEYENIARKVNKSDLLKLQLAFAKRKEYLNNSSDFFFVGKKY